MRLPQQAVDSFIAVGLQCFGHGNRFEITDHIALNKLILLAPILAVMLAACGGETATTATQVPTPSPTEIPTLVPTQPPATAATPVPPTASAASAATPVPYPTDTPASAEPKQFAEAPAITIDSAINYVATISTNLGDMAIELFPATAPITVNNFVFLAREGFYDGVVFHRVIPDFMIQGGDPTGTGGGGPGYRCEDEFDSPLEFDRPGILAMANAGPNTNGSQFFITVVPTPHLNGAHTIFGQVLEGQGIADAISMVPADAGGRPAEPVIINGVEITEKSAN